MLCIWCWHHVALRWRNTNTASRHSSPSPLGEFVRLHSQDVQYSEHRERFYPLNRPWTRRPRDSMIQRPLQNRSFKPGCVKLVLSKISRKLHASVWSKSRCYIYKLACRNVLPCVSLRLASSGSCLRWSALVVVTELTSKCSILGVQNASQLDHRSSVSGFKMVLDLIKLAKFWYLKPSCVSCWLCLTRPRLLPLTTQKCVTARSQKWPLLPKRWRGGERLRFNDVIKVTLVTCWRANQGPLSGLGQTA